MNRAEETVSFDRIMEKARRLDLGRYGYRITSHDEDSRVKGNGVFVYIESTDKSNRFNAMYSGFSDHKGGWSYYYDEKEGFLGGWVDIDPNNLINLIKITNYLTSGI